MSRNGTIFAICLLSCIAIEMMDFYDKVYQVVRQIPSGRVTTYGAIAKFIGAPQSARMVGYALNGCLDQTEFVPAHRVVNRNGLLTGKRYFGGNTMEELLSCEGVTVSDNRIVNFDRHFWNPAQKLKDTLGNR